VRAEAAYRETKPRRGKNDDVKSAAAGRKGLGSGSVLWFWRGGGIVRLPPEGSAGFSADELQGIEQIGVEAVS